jgi:hypothetical protein
MRADPLFHRMNEMRLIIRSRRRNSIKIGSHMPPDMTMKVILRA